MPRRAGRRNRPAASRRGQRLALSLGRPCQFEGVAAGGGIGEVTFVGKALILKRAAGPERYQRALPLREEMRRARFASEDAGSLPGGYRNEQ